MADEKKYTAKVTKLPQSEVEVSISVPNEEVKKATEETYKKLAKNVKVEGFRKGRAPRETILAQIGPALYEETINALLPSVTIEVLESEGLTPVDRIKYEIEEFEEEKGLKYKATFPVYPEVKIGNLKKVKVKKEGVTVTDEDYEKVLGEMFEDWKRREEAKLTGEQAKRETKDEKEDDDPITKAAKAAKKSDVILKYSEPTDKWAEEETNLGVANLAELKKKVMAEIQKQKESIAEATYQNKLIEEALKQTQIEVPNAYVERELDRRVEQYKARTESLGLKLEDFLKAQKSSIEKLREGWRDNAEVFIKSELFLLQLAKDEDLEITDEDVQKQIDDVKDENTKKQLDNEQGREYIRQTLLRQAAFKRLLEIVG